MQGRRDYRPTARPAGPGLPEPVFPATREGGFKADGVGGPGTSCDPGAGLAGLPVGDDYDPMAHGDIWECMSRPADSAAALKPAGLAAPEMTAKQNQDGPVCAAGVLLLHRRLR